MGYRHGPSRQLYDLAKIFLGFTLASKYAGSFGIFLTRSGVIYPDTWAVLLLIGFLLLFILYWGVVLGVEWGYAHYLEQKAQAFKALSGGVITFAEALLLLTFGLFILSQFKPVKNNFYHYMNQRSMIYPSMDRFCRKVVTVGFVNSLTSNNSGSSSKDILLKTLTDKKTYEILGQ